MARVDALLPGSSKRPMLGVVAAIVRRPTLAIALLAMSVTQPAVGAWVDQRRTSGPGAHPLSHGCSLT